MVIFDKFWDFGLSKYFSKCSQNQINWIFDKPQCGHNCWRGYAMNLTHLCRMKDSKRSTMCRRTCLLFPNVFTFWNSEFDFWTIDCMWIGKLRNSFCIIHQLDMMNEETSCTRQYCSVLCWSKTSRCFQLGKHSQRWGIRWVTISPIFLTMSFTPVVLNNDGKIQLQ